jgi:hypothetical protein
MCDIPVKSIGILIYSRAIRPYLRLVKIRLHLIISLMLHALLCSCVTHPPTRPMRVKCNPQNGIPSFVLNVTALYCRPGLFIAT